MFFWVSDSALPHVVEVVREVPDVDDHVVHAGLGLLLEPAVQGQSDREIEEGE